MSAALLSLRKATIRFGGLVAVNAVDLDVPHHSLAGLIGPNGAGKTTAFNLVTGVYAPTAGEILFDGRKLNHLRPHEIARLGISRTFQNIRLFRGLTALENVMVGGFLHHRSTLVGAISYSPGVLRETNELRNEALRLLRLFNLQDTAHTRSCDLPYGMQRRLEIARALATNPKLLLLDEPAAGMNPMESGELMRDIRRLRDEFGQTILLIEHDMKFVMGICERITVLDYGLVIASGAPEEIRNNPKVIEAYLGEPI